MERKKTTSWWYSISKEQVRVAGKNRFLLKLVISYWTNWYGKNVRPTTVTGGRFDSLFFFSALLKLIVTIRQNVNNKLDKFNNSKLLIMKNVPMKTLVIIWFLWYGVYFEISEWSIPFIIRSTVNVHVFTIFNPDFRWR